jgi:hypothetical protein
MAVDKSGPFGFPKITDQYPVYSQHLASEIQKLESLPDFQDDKGLYIVSDYGGEHKGAAFNTYAFLISSADKHGVFHRKMLELREARGLTSPAVEFAYKNLQYGPISRALEEYLTLANKFIHGVLVTISVDKSISSIFGDSKGQVRAYLTNLLLERNLGSWKRGNCREAVPYLSPHRNVSVIAFARRAEVHLDE